LYCNDYLEFGFRWTGDEQMPKPRCVFAVRSCPMKQWFQLNWEDTPLPITLTFKLKRWLIFKDCCKLIQGKGNYFRKQWPCQKELNSYEVAEIIALKSSLMSLRNQWFFQCCDRKSRVPCAQSFAPCQQTKIEFMRRNHSCYMESLIKTPMLYSVSYFYLGSLALCLGGLSPPKPPPWRRDCNRGAAKFLQPWNCATM